MHIDEEQHLKVSVIIPTLNAGEDFASLLKKLNMQTIKPHEIIVADSESDDDTVNIAEAHGALVLNIKRKDFDHGSTRNAAADYATGDIFMFMTQDAIPLDNRLIEKLVEPFLNNDNKVAYSYARQIADESGHLFERIAREVNYPAESCIKGYEDIKTLGIKTFFCSNACSAIKREDFHRLGGFVYPTIFNEDLFMAARLVLTGKYIAYCADAKVYHTHTYTIKQQFKRYFDNGMSMRMQSWILPYAKATKAGSGMVKKQLAGVIKSKKLYLIPKLIVEAGAKFIGYKLGINAHRLPSFMISRLSMHKLISLKLINNEANNLQAKNKTSTM